MYPKKSVEREMEDVVHEEEFFDSFQNSPCVLDNVFPEFLDAKDDLAIYEEHSIRDLLQLDSIYRDRFVVDTVGTHSTELAEECEANLLASEKAMDLLTDDSWLISVAAFSTFTTQNVPVIFDTGASLSITPYSADFIVPPTAPKNTIKLGGMAGNLDIMGVGTVSWTFLASNGLEIQIRTLAYWVPNAKARLLSPQKLFKKSQGVFGRYEGDEDTFNLYLNNNPPITVAYDDRSSLPIGYAHTGAVPEPQVKIALINENENLSEGQKLLLEWHNRFGHLNFPRVQQVLRHVPFIANKFGPAVRCDAPKCHTCEIAKAKRRARKSTLQTKVTERDGALTSGHVKVGARVSVDHFESRLQGRTYDSYGKPSSTKFVGGALFVDHA
jgi:hypothetical protein